MGFDSVIRFVEETLSNDERAVKLQRLNKELSSLELKRKKLTDMLLDDKITKEAYDVKYSDMTRKMCIQLYKTTHTETICKLSRQNRKPDDYLKVGIDVDKIHEILDKEKVEK